MKILYLSTSYIPSRTANSIHVMKMSQAFACLGHQVHLASIGKRDEYEPGVTNLFDFYGVKPCFRIHRLWHSPVRGGRLLNLLSLCFMLVRHRSDLSYARNPLFAWLAVKLGHCCMLELHTPLHPDDHLGRRYFQRVMRMPRLKKLVVISDALKRMFIEKHALKADRICVAHDGADPYKSSRTSKKIVSYPGKELHVGYTGHLYKGRGIGIVLELARAFPNIHFHIAGGNEEDIEYWLDKVKQQNVSFYGFIPPAEIDAWRCQCDVLIAPYEKQVEVYGGGTDTSQFMSPLKIFEYMACNRPILTSDMPVLREVLHPNNAKLAPPENVGAWVAALESLMDPSERARLARNALEDFQRHYTWDARARFLLSQFSPCSSSDMGYPEGNTV